MDYHSQNIEKHLDYLNYLKNSIASTGTLEHKVDLLKNAYEYIKKISWEFYIGDGKCIASEYDRVLLLLDKCERSLPHVFIADTKIQKFSKVNQKPTSPEELLDSLVYKTRMYLKAKLSKTASGNFEDMDLQNLCRNSANRVALLCLMRGIKQKKYKIEPGFERHSELYCGTGWHYFNIVELDRRHFLIDCTYSQFFLLKRCILEKIGIMKWPGASAGAFMENGSRRFVRDHILKYGWIELDEETLKDYLDGFAISYRNGLYYEENMDYSYTTTYSSSDYRNFLGGRDSQTNHEKRSHLGFQMRPLKNSNLKF